MSVKHSTSTRVGYTYGERRGAEQSKLSEPSHQTAESTSFLRKLRDFFSVDPKIASAEFAANTKFLPGENLPPLQALGDISRRRPGVSDEHLLSDIAAILHPAPRSSKTA